MGWSKVDKQHTKPVKWWVNKVLCELAWACGNRGKWYYHFLNKCCDCGFTLYGRKL